MRAFFFITIMRGPWLIGLGEGFIAPWTFGFGFYLSAIGVICLLISGVAFSLMEKVFRKKKLVKL